MLFDSQPSIVLVLASDATRQQLYSNIFFGRFSVEAPPKIVILYNIKNESQDGNIPDVLYIPLTKYSLQSIVKCVQVTKPHSVFSVPLE